MLPFILVWESHMTVEEITEVITAVGAARENVCITPKGAKDGEIGVMRYDTGTGFEWT